MCWMAQYHQLSEWVPHFTGFFRFVKHRTVYNIYYNKLTEFDYFVREKLGPILGGLQVWDSYVDRKFYGSVELYRLHVSLCVGKLYVMKWKGHCLSAVFIWWHFLPSSPLPPPPACDLFPHFFDDPTRSFEQRDGDGDWINKSVWGWKYSSQNFKRDENDQMPCVWFSYVHGSNNRRECLGACVMPSCRGCCNLLPQSAVYQLYISGKAAPLWRMSFVAGKRKPWSLP